MSDDMHDVAWRIDVLVIRNSLKHETSNDEALPFTLTPFLH